MTTSTDTRSVSATRRQAIDWRSRAACLDVDVDAEIFYVVPQSGEAYDAQVAEAKAVCWRCPVREVCLGDAIERGDAWAVLGGTTPEERRALGAQLRRSVKP